MIEAKPEKVLAPKENEPLLRVGVVIREDRFSSLKFKTLSYKLELFTDKESIELTPETAYQAAVIDGKITVKSNQEKQLIKPAGTVRIRASKKDVRNKLDSLLECDQIVAGRGFHWEQRYKLCFPGSFELSAQDDSLTLVNIVNFENYIASVITSEMGSSCPAEFLKAQAVAARSWAHVFLSNKHPDENFDVCNDDDCQRYQGTTHLSKEVAEAVSSCRGEFILNQDESVCAAYYSKNCGGVSELPEDIFGFKLHAFQAASDAKKSTKLNLSTDEAFASWITEPNEAFCSESFVKHTDYKHYLGAVDRNEHYFRWSCKLSVTELIRNLGRKFNLTDILKITDLTPLKRSQSGTITRLCISYLDQANKEKNLTLENQYDIRRALHPSFLYSSAFILDKLRTEQKELCEIHFKGSGWGHGVGLCQIGALGRALAGEDYCSILKHYYPCTYIRKTY